MSFDIISHCPKAKASSPFGLDLSSSSLPTMLCWILLHNDKEPVPEPNAVLPEPIDKAADIAALSEKAARAQKNRLIMKEFVQRSRAARTRTGLHQGPIFHDVSFMTLMGNEGLQAYEDKPKLLNDGTYLIFQKWAGLLFHDQFIKPNLCSTLITNLIV
jgi:hypothetical protein